MQTSGFDTPQHKPFLEVEGLVQILSGLPVRSIVKDGVEPLQGCAIIFVEYEKENKNIQTQHKTGRRFNCFNMWIS